jgi:hypothetical protein
MIKFFTHTPDNEFLQASLALKMVFWVFWGSTRLFSSYRKVRSAWRCELVSTVKRCELCCELADTVSATKYVANLCFGDFKRISDFQMAREAWDNCLGVSLKLEGHLTRRRNALKGHFIMHIKDVRIVSSISLFVAVCYF